MPEGDTLRRLAAKINDRFEGDIVDRSVMRDPRLAGADLAGRTLLAADAYGKHLFIRFDDDRSLHAHLLMTGSFEVGPASRESEWHRRLELWMGRGRLTAVDVPLLGLVKTSGEPELIGHLGPDLCAVAGPPDSDEIVRRLVRAPDEPLVGALLDQRNVAGFGNLYATELPFIVGLHPSQPIGSIDGLAGAVGIGTALIRVNAQRGPQNTVGKRLGQDARWVHGVGRRPCPICGTRLARWSESESPWGRVTTWCPSCQPVGDRATVDLTRARRLIGLHPAVKEPTFPPL